MSEKELLEQGYSKYHGKTIDIYFKRELCIKSANCVLGNHDVFDTSRKPWILPDNDKTGNVKEVIDRCPS